MGRVVGIGRERKRNERIWKESKGKGEMRRGRDKDG